MVVLGAVRVQCPFCRKVQFHPIARRYRCRSCARDFTAAQAREAAKTSAPKSPRHGGQSRRRS